MTWILWLLMKCKNFLPCFAHTQFGKDLHVPPEEKGISFPTLLHKDIAHLRLSALHIHCLYPTWFALSLICLTHLCARTDFRVGWSNWWTSNHIWTGVEHVFFQGIRHGVSLVLQQEMLWFLASLWHEGAAAACRTQLWWEQAVLAKLQLVHCFLLRGAWWNCPDSLSENEQSSKIFSPYNVRFLVYCSKTVSCDIFKVLFRRKHHVWMKAALLFYITISFCFVILSFATVLSEWLPFSVSASNFRKLL